MQDKQFDEELNETEINTWFLFNRIHNDLLGNHKAVNYQNVVQELLTSYKAMGCNMSLRHTWIFSSKISTKSVRNMVKDFTMILCLWESSTKASGPQVCWQTIAGH
jgi:hypothetical protein